MALPLTYFMRSSFWIVLVGLLCISQAARAQTTNSTNFTTSTAEIDTINSTPVTQQVNAFKTELKARMQSGSYLYDQTFNAALADSSVTAAITAAKNVLIGAGAVTFAGPTQLSSTQSTTSSTSTLQTGSQSTPTALTYTYVGPITVPVANHGVCQSYSATGGPQGGPLLTGCSLPGSPFTLSPGQIDIDTLITSFVTISQTVTTTNTTLTSQVYEIVGVPAVGPTPPATPAPPSLILGLTGLASAGLYTVRQRLRRQRS